LYCSQIWLNPVVADLIATFAATSEIKKRKKEKKKTLVQRLLAKELGVLNRESFFFFSSPFFRLFWGLFGLVPKV
jgi:hypothetical protein